MSKLSKREKGLLVILLITVAGVIYYSFVLKDFLSDYRNLDLQITNTRNMIQDYKLKNTSVKMIDDNLDKLHEEIDGNLDKVLEGIDRPEILRMLSRKFSVLDEQPFYRFPAGYITLKENYIVTVEADFIASEEQFMNILNSFKKAEYVNRILSASYISGDSSADKGSARIDIEILTRGLIPPVS